MGKMMKGRRVNMAIKADEKIKELLQGDNSCKTESEDAMAGWKDCNDEIWSNLSVEERKES